MNNGLDLNKYLHSINSNAAIKAVQDKAGRTEESESVSGINMQFNQESNGVPYAKTWIS